MSSRARIHGLRLPWNHQEPRVRIFWKTVAAVVVVVVENFYTGLCFPFFDTDAQRIVVVLCVFSMPYPLRRKRVFHYICATILSILYAWHTHYVRSQTIVGRMEHNTTTLCNVLFYRSRSHCFSLRILPFCKPSLLHSTPPIIPPSIYYSRNIGGASDTQYENNFTITFPHISLRSLHKSLRIRA